MSQLQSDGTFDAVIRSVILGTSTNGHLELKIGYEVEATGETITGFHYLSGKNGVNENLLGHLKGIGYDGSSLWLLAEQITGKRCSIVVEWEEQQGGGEKLRVKWLNAPGGGGDLAGALKIWAELTGNKPPADFVPGSSKPAAAAPIDDSDVPF